MVNGEVELGPVIVLDDEGQSYLSTVQKQLPTEIVDEILVAFLRIAELADYHAKPSTYYRALVPFNVHRKTRNQAAKMMARHLRFVGTLNMYRTYDAFTLPLYDFTITPEPSTLLPYLRHLELRVPLGNLTETKIVALDVMFTTAQIMDASTRRRDVQWFVKNAMGAHLMPQLKTITYALDCFMHPDELSAWWVLPKCAAIVRVVDQI
jgi:hypothetical protein